MYLGIFGTLLKTVHACSLHRDAVSLVPTSLLSTSLWILGNLYKVLVSQKSTNASHLGSVLVDYGASNEVEDHAELAERLEKRKKKKKNRA